MRVGIKALARLLALAGALDAGPSAAQYMMHLDPNLYMFIAMNMGGRVDPCMTGTAMSERKIAEARTPALAVMQAYFRAAQGGGAKSAAFHLDKNTRWQGGGAKAGSLEVDRQTDPLVASGNVLEAEPLRFYRGGAGATALGQWAVVDTQGQVAGIYTALFARVGKVWKLRELTAFQAGETAAPAAQYCRRPGDVMEYRLSSTKSWREGAQRSVDEARSKTAEAAARDVAATAGALAKPRDKRLEIAARDAGRNLAYWTKQLEQREKNLTQATEKAAEAQRDADELKRLTDDSRNARAFRVAARAGS